MTTHERERESGNGKREIAMEKRETGNREQERGTKSLSFGQRFKL